MATLTKAQISADDDSHKFYVQFNPNEISIEENVGRYRKSAVSTPKQQGETNGVNEPQPQPFAEDAGLSFSTRLFFNTYQSDTTYSDVRKQFAGLYYFFSPKTRDSTGESLNKIRFSWGTISITGILTSMRVGYSMFAPDGTPVRAEVSIGIDGHYTGSNASITQDESAGAAAAFEKGTASLMDQIAALSDPAGWRNLAAAKQKANSRPSVVEG